MQPPLWTHHVPRDNKMGSPWLGHDDPQDPHIRHVIDNICGLSCTGETLGYYVPTVLHGAVVFFHDSPCGVHLPSGKIVPPTTPS
jgi:hypothetical protein